MTAIQTYANDASFKAAFLAEIGKHEAADQLMKGTYGQCDGQKFVGCAIGCANHSLNILQGKADPDEGTGSHERVAADLGWPLWLAYLQDHLFESLPEAESQTWPRRLAEAIPVGAVIDDTVLAKILVWSLTAERFGVIHVTDDAEIKGYISAIAEFITADAAGQATAEQREGAARDARAAWDARDAWAAWDAWDAWAARAARDAWPAWAARDAWPAWAEFDLALSEYVLSVLRALPVASLKHGEGA